MEHRSLAEMLSRAKSAKSDFDRLTVFDVGANVGQSFRLFRKFLPDATIHCFEPVPKTFSRLQEAVSDDELAFAHQLGLASNVGHVRFTSNLNTGNHQVLEGEQLSKDEIEVEVATGDSICGDLGIEFIDYLKIDAEGYDLDVLLGFSDMLRKGRVAYLQVECSTNLDNRFHVHLERFIHFLHPFNYRLSDLIEPVRRVNSTNQALNGIWYCNAVFAREVENPALRRDGVN
ncbi:FkbM family methyltransferase [Ruegeria atlantica]|uniref:FkbM family methyltransferase n=1 Tax=Ruegeria atlantica TaxID=81569 RepID=UPI00147DCF10|nr:FkbM family methyltransferase [Ruegeria atlantica]